MPDELEQWEKRKAVKMTDPHGRRWAAVVDKTAKGNGWVHIAPDGWSAPKPELVPPLNCLQADAEDDRRITIDYAKWIEMRESAVTQWEDDIQRWALSLPGENFATCLEKPSMALLKMCGPKPMAATPIEYARDGSKWALGIKDDDGTPRPMPKWAEVYWPVVKTVAKTPARDLDAELDAEIADLVDLDEREDAREQARAESALRGLTEDDLDEIEETYDPEATGGQRVPPQKPKGKGGRPRKPKPVLQDA